MRSTSKMSKAFLGGGFVLLLTFTSHAPAQAALIRLDFTGTVISTFGVPNAGTSVSGFITFDPSTPLTSSCGAHCGSYSQFASATFFFTTNGGFTLQQTLTTINIQDKFANGITDFYVFDADVGSFSSSTHFSRLELTLSNNSNPFIPDISIPTTPPDFSAFQFHTVAFFGFDGFEPTQRVLAILTSLTSGVPESIVAIDIKPGSFPNSINPGSRGVIPVAILTTGTFDATTVDSNTVRFGKTGTEAAMAQGAFFDVDGDGDTDLILHFRTEQTGIQCGAIAAFLTGKTLSGQAFKGSDTINTVGCK